MYKAKYSQRNRRYVLKQKARHRPICTCGTYLKTAYVLDRVNRTSSWTKIGYFCPSCSDFYLGPPSQEIVDSQVATKEENIEDLKHNLEKLFSIFD